MWSTFWWWIWMAGVIHSRQLHFLPDQTTSPILAEHFGHFSFTSFSWAWGNQGGGSMKYEEHC